MAELVWQGSTQLSGDTLKSETRRNTQSESAFPAPPLECRGMQGNHWQKGFNDERLNRWPWLKAPPLE